MTDRAYYLDISSLTTGVEPTPVSTEPTGGRPWIGMHFQCCGVYVRIYRNNDATAYRGACPHCGKSVRLRVGADGVDARFFTAE